MAKISFRDARKQAGLTIVELAEKSQISKSQISDIERGLKYPTTYTLCRIAHALNVPYCDLCDCETILNSVNNT